MCLHGVVKHFLSLFRTFARIKNFKAFEIQLKGEAVPKLRLLEEKIRLADMRSLSNYLEFE
jgi:hypothetical protein